MQKMLDPIVKNSFFQTIVRLSNAIKNHDHPKLAELISPVFRGVPEVPDLVKDLSNNPTVEAQALNFKEMRDFVLSEIAKNKRMGKRQSVVYGITDRDAHANYFAYDPSPVADGGDSSVEYKHLLRFNGSTLEGGKFSYYDDAAPDNKWIANTGDILKANTIAKSSGDFDYGVVGAKGLTILANSIKVANTSATLPQYGKTNNWSESMFFKIGSLATDNDGYRTIFSSGKSSNRGLFILVKKFSSAPQNRICVYADNTGTSNNEIYFEDPDTNVVANTEYHVEVIYDYDRGRFILVVNNQVKAVCIRHSLTSANLPAFAALLPSLYTRAVYMPNTLPWTTGTTEAAVRARYVGAKLTITSGPYAGEVRTITDIGGLGDNTANNENFIVDVPFPAPIANGTTYNIGWRSVFAGLADNTITQREIGSNSTTGNQNKGLIKIDLYAFKYLNDIASYIGANYLTLAHGNTLAIKPTVEPNLTNFNNTLFLKNPRFYVGLYCSAANVFDDYLFDVFSQNDLINGNDLPFPELPLNNRSYLYAEYDRSTKEVTLGHSPMPTVYAPKYLPGRFSLLSFPKFFQKTAQTAGADYIQIDHYGFLNTTLNDYTVSIISGMGVGQVRTIDHNNAWQLFVTEDWVTIPNNTSVFKVYSTDDVAYDKGGNYWTRSEDIDDTNNAVVVSEGGAIFDTSGSYPAFMKSEIQALAEKWTIKLRLKKASPAHTGVIFSYTEDLGAEPTSGGGPTYHRKGIWLTSDSSHLILHWWDGAAEQTLSVTASAWSTTADLDIEVWFDGEHYGIGCSSNGNNLNRSESPGGQVAAVVEPATTLTLKPGAGMPGVIIKGFAYMPFVWGKCFHGDNADTVTDFDNYIGIMDMVTFYNTDINIMYVGADWDGSMGDAPTFGIDHARVYLGDVVLDSDKIVEINSYALNGRYQSNWSYINNATGSMGIQHNVGSDDVNVTVYGNTLPQDRNKWKGEGGDATHGLGVKNITRNKLDLVVGTTTIVPPIIGANTEGYVKVIADRIW